MTLRRTMTFVMAVCVVGAARAAFAQDDAEDSVVDEVDAVTILDGVSDANAADDSNAPKPKSKSGKSKKPGKSPQAENSSYNVDNVDAAAEQSTGKTGNAGANLKFNGLVAVGVDINKKMNRKTKKDEVERGRVGKGELELSVQPVKKVRAEIGIEYNVNGRTMVADSLKGRRIPVGDPDIGVTALENVDLLKGLPLGPFVTIDKLYAQYNIIDNGQIRAGIMKKAFGFEERAGLDERYFLKRSIISDGLKERGFLDHDLTAAYRHDLLNDRVRLTGAFSWSAADSLAYLQNYSAHYRPGKDMEFILAGIIRHCSGGAARSTDFAATLAFRHNAAINLVSEAELTVGVARDSVTELNLATDTYKTVLRKKTALLGIRAQEQYPVDINTKTLRRVVPAVEAAFHTADADSGYAEAQFRAGVTLGFAKNSAFQFRNNIGTVIRTPKFRTAGWWKNLGKDSEVRRYRFDSEVVVVF